MTCGALVPSCVLGLSRNLIWIMLTGKMA